MNRNVESHFAQLPSVDIQRSIFDRSHTHKTSFNVGELIPFYIDEVVPGDTFNVTTSIVGRLQTLLTPVMDNLYLDLYYFYCRDIILWNHFKEFCGENSGSAWIPQVTYQIPSISSPNGGFESGTIADYFGLPVGVAWDNDAPRRPSALPFRAYALICNEFFRSTPLTDPLNISFGDSNQTGSNGGNYINDVANGGKPFKVAKFHDYLTSSLPSPQRGEAVSLKLSGATLAPVGTTGVNHSFTSGGFGTTALRWAPTSSATTPAEGEKFALGAYANASQAASGYWVAQGLQSSATLLQDHSVAPLNLSADVGSVLSAVTVNELRLAFQLQKYYEKLARGGSRYTEWLQVNFGVTSPDSHLYRPEYLGGKRIPINIQQVLNNAQTQTDFLGDVGAMSVTSDVDQSFVHSFDQHGYVIGVCCLRYDHSYPQGLERFWSRRTITDFYLPVFANIGEQPVFKSEIFADATNMDANYVFGYQEAWADYRYKPDRVSGEMRPGIQNSLASWHFADYYQSSPTLSDAWIREDKSNVDRTLAVTSSNANQFFCDFYIKNIATRPMPMYSIPGLIDHN